MSGYLKNRWTGIKSARLRYTVRNVSSLIGELVVAIKVYLRVKLAKRPN